MGDNTMSEQIRPSLPEIPNYENQKIGDQQEAQKPVEQPVDSGIRDTILEGSDNSKIKFSTDRQGNTTVTTTNGESVTFSMNFQNPALTPPTSPPDAHALVTHSGGNEWFAVSFMAVFTTVMAELAAMLSKLRYEEGLETIQAREMQAETAKSKAALVKESARIEAQKEITNAIMSFTTAAMAGMTIVLTANVQRTIDRNPEVAKAKLERDTSLNNLNNKITNRAANETGFDKNSYITPKDFHKDPNTALEKNPGLKSHYEDYSKANQKYEQTKYTQEQVQITKLRSVQDFSRSFAEGCGATARAFFTDAKGTVDALIQMYDLYGKILQDFAGTSQKARDDAGAAFNEVIRTMKETVSKDYQAFSQKG